MQQRLDQGGCVVFEHVGAESEMRTSRMLLMTGLFTKHSHCLARRFDILTGAVLMAVRTRHGILRLKSKQDNTAQFEIPRETRLPPGLDLGLAKSFRPCSGCWQHSFPPHRMQDPHAIARACKT